MPSTRPPLALLSRAKESLAACATGVLCAALMLGCKYSAPAPQPVVKSQVPRYPVRPSIAVPAFTLFHQTKDSLTLVTDDHAADDQIAAILWQLHDASKTHDFDKLGLPQKLIDARDPIVWFHLYRGARCASEKYTEGKLPCGASYHAAGDYTLGGFTNKDRDDAVLLHGDDKEMHLWNPDGPH